jgi:hypothetical protein
MKEEKDEEEEDVKYKGTESKDSKASIGTTQTRISKS